MEYIKFLGTAGARFVMIRQLRASGGMWFSVCNTNFIVDPGPGCLVNIVKSRPKLDPAKLDFIFLSHKHLDHSCDINLMIEAMSNGGYNKRGVVLAPEDALTVDPVIFKYILNYLERIETIVAGNTYKIDNIRLEIPIKLRHSVETYGFKMKCQGLPVISYLPDTGFFEELIEAYAGSDILIINTVMYERRNGVSHLSLPETEEIIKGVKPKKAILTHFGMQMLQNKIWQKDAEISERTGTEVIIADDGMSIDLKDI
jgi:ribonuclease BN (tRNA processing enzyme)